MHHDNVSPSQFDTWPFHLIQNHGNQEMIRTSVISQFEGVNRNAESHFEFITLLALFMSSLRAERSNNRLKG
jgi:hypothetical protein